MNIMRRIILGRLKNLETMSVKKVLITSAGTGNAYAAAEAVNMFFGDEVELFLTDINEKHLISSTNFKSNFIKTPRISDKAYIYFIRDILELTQLDIVIPFIDQDVKLFAQLFKEFNFITPVQIQQSADICYDKYETFKWLKKNGIRTPESKLLGSFESNNINYIIKPRSGFGSLIMPYNLENYKKVKSTLHEFICQQRLENPEITVDVFNSNGVFEYICRERIETKNGVCTKARLFKDEKLEFLALKLSLGLGLKYFCFQVMRCDENWSVTDINPRLGSGTPMSKVVGLDFFAAMVGDLLGRNVEGFLQYINEEKFVTRQYLNILSK
jgi:hypothetical protein